MKLLIPAVLLFLVSGCSYLTDFRNKVGTDGSEAADTIYHDSRWGVCEVTTSGALTRENDTYEEFVRWARFCGYDYLIDTK